MAIVIVLTADEQAQVQQLKAVLATAVAAYQDAAQALQAYAVSLRNKYVVIQSGGQNYVLGGFVGGCQLSPDGTSLIATRQRPGGI